MKIPPYSSVRWTSATIDPMYLRKYKDVQMLSMVPQALTSSSREQRIGLNNVPKGLGLSNLGIFGVLHILSRCFVPVGGISLINGIDLS
mmetsp:Transcript_28963/g.112681  ORF Transcript_28963/g.112681 Transcript_28963/m.112681 type:complete len:89 (-) Transcript_28963:798-1064(-)